MKSLLYNIPINVLLADDDQDDRFFFSKALKALPFETHLTAIEDGEKLMTYLFLNATKLPNVLFLDHNMPRKNGFECLSEIKLNLKLKSIPIIMYSTYVNEDIAEMFYKAGAHYYMRKAEQEDFTKILYHIFSLIAEKRFARPPRDKFILSLLEA